MSPQLKTEIVLGVLKILLIFTIYNIGVMMVIWAERRVSAWKQYRLGPNRVGPFGLLQSVADGVKNIMKEETFPAEANRPLFLLAPLMSFIPAMLTFAVLPFAAPIPPFDITLPWFLGGRWVNPELAPFMIADLPVGMLFILAVGSLGVYGIVLAGWASNSKYAFLGGLRASAQMVSYEVALGFSVTSIFLLAGNVTLNEIVLAQQEMQLWYIAPLLLAFILFFISALAETNRLPFDLPETESELTTGYHTEYSSMKFSMFFIAEYAHIITGASLIAILFFGGWDIPFLNEAAMQANGGWLAWAVVPITGFAFFLKALFFIYCYIWIRWTLPRFRFDQLMQLGWKFMLPLSLVYIIVIAATVLIMEQAGLSVGPLYGGILFLVNAVIVYLVFGVFDRGRILEGAAHRRVEA